MPTQRTPRSDNEVTLTRIAIFVATLIGFAATWSLFVVAPPDGFVSPFAMAISFIAGAYLLVLVYSYLK